MLVSRAGIFIFGIFVSALTRWKVWRFKLLADSGKNSKVLLNTRAREFLTFQATC